MGIALNAKRSEKSKTVPLSLLGMIVTLGIVYGDIGTSPLYVMKACIGGNGGMGHVNAEFIIGCVSLVMWTVTLLTTIKYGLIAMSADNHGEGGIFALYSLVRKYGKWLVVPAMIGGAALLADGILTPAVTVTSAVEGLRSISGFNILLGTSSTRIVIIAISIITLLFFVQQMGTSSIGRAFGPLMVLWFLFLGITGAINLTGNFDILRAFNPMRGISILFSPYNAVGVKLLGAVFLATTGAEALYSDMGHVGKKNIHGSWPFVNVCLFLNYLGQGAWLINNLNNPAYRGIEDFNPFFEMLPAEMRIFAVLLATVAAIIASQALITGSFTLVSEAISLDLLPHLRINYPSQTKSQMYIPMINNLMWIACIGVVLFFRTSSSMEAAYGLAITVTMLSTTTLLYAYLRRNHKGHPLARVVFLVFFGVLEGIFFASSLAKFMHGGYVTIIIALFLLVIMVVWYKGTSIENSQKESRKLRKYIPTLEALRNDERLSLYAENLVYMTRQKFDGTIDRDVLYSLLDKLPKRARSYFLVSVKVTDAPYTRSYRVENFGTDFLFRVEFQLGYKVSQRIRPYLFQVMRDLIKSGEMPAQDNIYSIYGPRTVGYSRFCFLRKQIATEAEITLSQWIVMRLKYGIRRITGSPMKWYGLEDALVTFEDIPLFTKQKKLKKLHRICPTSPTSFGTKHSLTECDIEHSRKAARAGEILEGQVICCNPDDKADDVRELDSDDRAESSGELGESGLTGVIPKVIDGKRPDVPSVYYAPDSQECDDDK